MGFHCQHDTYSPPNVTVVIRSSRMRWVKYVARLGESINTLTVFMGQYDGNRRLGIPRQRWENSIKMDLKED